MYSRTIKSTAMLLAVLFFHLAWISASRAEVTITYINLGAGGTALLRVPPPLGGNLRDHIGIFVMHPSSSFINSPICTELANRGYRTLCADNPFSFNGNGYKGYEDHSAIIARGINCLKGQNPPGQTSSPCSSITGITKIIIIGHSMAGPMMAFYQNIAENGAAVCQKPERLLPCDPTNLSNLPKADGVILLDSHLGDAVATMTYTDPAVIREQQPDLRESRIDMFDPANGYDTNTNGATYSDKFRKAFLAGQSRRNNKLIDEALEQLSDIINDRRNVYPDDMPFVVPGSNGARLWQADIQLLKCTQAAYLLLTNANPTGEGPKQICSVRLPAGNLGALTFDSVTSVSVQIWLGAHSVRTTKDYNQTPDDITGIVYESSNTNPVDLLDKSTLPNVPIPGKSYTVLVPRTDVDGNDIAGVRHPNIQVPVATYTGWALRRAPFAEGEDCALTGQYIPFAATKAERLAKGDPRLSIEERYKTHGQYVSRVALAADRLVRQRLLLDEDAVAIITEAAESDVGK